MREVAEVYVRFAVIEGMPRVTAKERLGCVKPLKFTCVLQ